MYQHCRNKIGMNGVVVWEKKIKCFVRFSRPLTNLKFGQFTSFAGRGRQINVPIRYLKGKKIKKTHVQGVQSYCFAQLDPFFCGVLVAVDVALA